ncbi:hypothetical protein DXV76_11060 [Rhodobacteraceae bacterium CCMM004]|nr:hypothetical protein DXV76_11060 [Rhodobacteraceae bacterium CCMM004]
MTDFTSAAQRVLDDPRLTPYFHFDHRPPPLPLRNDTGADLDVPALTADGREVTEDGADDHALHVVSWSDEGGHGAMALRYPVEGLSITARLIRDGEVWRVEALDLVER